MNTKKWLEDRYTFFEEILEYEESYYLEFCLKEESWDFVKLCSYNDIAFTYRPPYGVAIEISYLKILIQKIDNNIFTKKLSDQIQVLH